MSSRPQTLRAAQVRRARPDDLEWIVDTHGAVYAAEYGWDDSFRTLVRDIAVEFFCDHDPNGEATWIAERNGERVGCVMCIRKSVGVAQLRLLLITPAARNAGIGSGLVERCILFARSCGYERIELWTNHRLLAARRLYERAGFTIVSEHPARDFGDEVIEQTFELRL